MVLVLASSSAAQSSRHLLGSLVSRCWVGEVGRHISSSVWLSTGNALAVPVTFCGCVVISANQERKPNVAFKKKPKMEWKALFFVLQPVSKGDCPIYLIENTFH